MTPSQDQKAAVAKIIRQMIAEGNARPLSERSEEAAERILSALIRDLWRAYCEAHDRAMLAAAPSQPLSEGGE